MKKGFAIFLIGLIGLFTLSLSGCYTLMKIQEGTGDDLRIPPEGMVLIPEIEKIPSPLITNMLGLSEMRVNDFLPFVRLAKWQKWQRRIPNPLITNMLELSEMRVNDFLPFVRLAKWQKWQRRIPNTLVTNMLELWERSVNDFLPFVRLAKWQNTWLVDASGFWEIRTNNALRLSHLAKWQWQQKGILDAAGYTVRGRDTLFGQHAYAAAIADFDKALSLAPEDTPASYYRATAKLLLGNAESAVDNTVQAQHHYHAAIQDYTEVIDRDPKNTEAYVMRSYVKFKLGIVASAVGNDKEAEHHYHAAIADCSQAMALYRKDEAALKAALAVYTDVVVDPGSAMVMRDRYAFVYHLRGLGKQALGQHTAAEADFRKAKVLQLMPENESPLAPTLGRRLGWD